jgi:AraC-like DNA-binding protein
MQVLSLLDNIDHGSLRRTVPDTWIVRQVSLGTAISELERRPVAALVVHPQMLATDALQALVTSAHLSGTRIVLYGEALAVGIRPLLELLASTHTDFVAMSPTGATAITSVLAMPAQSVPVRVLTAIGPRLLMLPAADATNAVRLFTYDDLPHDTAALSCSAEEDESSLRRHYKAAGLARPHKVLQAARLARALHFATRTHLSSGRIASQCGLKSVSRLQRICREHLAVTFAALSVELPIESAAQILAAAALR